MDPDPSGGRAPASLKHHLHVAELPAVHLRRLGALRSSARPRTPGPSSKAPARSRRHEGSRRRFPAALSRLRLPSPLALVPTADRKTVLHQPDIEARGRKSARTVPAHLTELRTPGCRDALRRLRARNFNSRHEQSAARLRANAWGGQSRASTVAERVPRCPTSGPSILREVLGERGEHQAPARIRVSSASQGAQDAPKNIDFMEQSRLLF